MLPQPLGRRQPLPKDHVLRGIDRLVTNDRLLGANEDCSPGPAWRWLCLLFNLWCCVLFVRKLV